MQNIVAAVALAFAASTLFGCASAKTEKAPVAPAVVSRASADGEPGETEADEEHERVASGDRDKVDADGVVRRGQPLTASLTATPVSAALKDVKSLDGKKVKLAGTVQNVCAKRGCWFVVQGDKPEDSIRISTRAHDIYVPHTAVGMKVVVEGTLSLKPGTNDIIIDVSGLEMTKG